MRDEIKEGKKKDESTIIKLYITHTNYYNNQISISKKIIYKQAAKRLGNKQKG